MSELVRREDNTPALPTPTTTDTDSWIQVVADVVHLAQHIAETSFVPKGLRGNAPATAAAILYGREVGLPPMTSLSQTHVIEGKPSMSAEAMRALVLAAGHDFEVVESSGAVCTMRGRRRGSQTWTSITWTIDMARAAKVTGKDNWQKYPRAMLQARCTAELARLVFPDVIHGFSAVEELEEPDEAPAETPSGQTVQRRTSTRRKATTKKAEPAPTPAVEDEAPPLPDEGTETSGAVLAPATGHNDGEEAARPARASSPSPDPAEGSAAGNAAPSADQDSGVGGAGKADTAAPPAPEVTEEDPEPREEAPPKPVTQAQLRMLFAALKQLGVDQKDDTERRYVAGRILGRDVQSLTTLNRRDVSQVIDTLARFKGAEDLWAFLDGLDQDALPIAEEPVDAEVVEDSE